MVKGKYPNKGKKKKKKNKGAKFSFVDLCSNLLMKKKEKKFKSNI
jgi:hypothetical protein